MLYLSSTFVDADGVLDLSWVSGNFVGDPNLSSPFGAFDASFLSLCVSGASTSLGSGLSVAVGVASVDCTGASTCLGIGNVSAFVGTMGTETKSFASFFL